MTLPTNVEVQLNSQKGESHRIEYKKGWNPDRIYRSICAFANNGSPAASFETDEDRLSFLVRIPCHEGEEGVSSAFMSAEANDKENKNPHKENDKEKQNDPVNDTINRKNGTIIGENDPTSSQPVVNQLPPTTQPVQMLILKASEEPQSVTELATKCGLKDIRYFRKEYLKPALEIGAIESIYPAKHPKQKYRLSQAAIEWKKELK